MRSRDLLRRWDLTQVDVRRWVQRAVVERQMPPWAGVLWIDEHVRVVLAVADRHPGLVLATEVRQDCRDAVNELVGHRTKHMDKPLGGDATAHCLFRSLPESALFASLCASGHELGSRHPSSSRETRRVSASCFAQLGEAARSSPLAGRDVEPG